LSEVIHIATHAFLDETNPQMSFLALADGALTADQIYQRRLKVNLVVISACETALGGQHPDSIIGLSNAFLIAGANSVVSTLWPISDAVSVQFMLEFYRQLKRGTNLATALSTAQRSLLNKAVTSDPFYWAPFRLNGRIVCPFGKRSHNLLKDKSSIPDGK